MFQCRPFSDIDFFKIFLQENFKGVKYKKRGFSRTTLWLKSPVWNILSRCDDNVLLEIKIAIFPKVFLNTF